MAKKNSIGTLPLFGAGTILFSLGWLMPSVPIFSFAGLAPFIAIAVNNRSEKSVWSSLELILLGLAISFFASTIFDFADLTRTTILAILFTFPFLGYTFVRKILGSGVSIFTFALFWLTIEYLAVKFYPADTLLLADLLRLKIDWIRWNNLTGYSGSSLWILLINTLLFQAFLTEKKVNWFMVVCFAISIIGPIAYSYTLENEPISRENMEQLYSGAGVPFDNYTRKGEIVSRTAAWISLLILLYTIVKTKTGKR